MAATESGLHVWMTRASRVAVIWLLGLSLAVADSDGRWRLTLDGSDRLAFGTRILAGGIIIGWQSVLEFQIRDGAFVQGSGRSRIVGDESPYSRPEGMFQCVQERGTFAAAGGKLSSTPHLRYRAFPVEGAVEAGDTVHLVPMMDFPGNYVAAIYRCETRNTLGDIWTARGDLVGRELGLRQNSSVELEAGVYSARVKEVRQISPDGELRLPLREGWRGEWGDARLGRVVALTLERIE